MLQTRTRRSLTLSRLESAGLEPEKLMRNWTRRSFTVSGPEPAGLESESVRTEALSESVFSCFQSRRAARNRPNVEQPSILLAQRAG